MDALDLDLYEPLAYDDDDEKNDDPAASDAVEDKHKSQNGRKRSTSGSVNIESPTRLSKRQRVEKSSSPVKRQGNQGVSTRNPDSENVVIIDDDVLSDNRVVIEEVESDDNDLIIDIDEFDPNSEKFDEAILEDIINKEKLHSRTNPSKSNLNTAKTGITNGSASSTTPNTKTSTSLRKTLGNEEIPNTVKFRRVLKRLPQDIPYLPITCEDGSRLYLRLKEKPVENDEEKEAAPLQCGRDKKNLMGNWDQIKAEARIIKDKFHKSLAKAVSNEVIPERSRNTSTSHDSLWVEKYKPNRFLDLLSLEAVNSGLLHWLKLWDKSVFCKDYMIKVKASREKYAKLEAMEKEREEKFPKKSYLPTNEEYDEGGRPVMKVALLSGDPGLGKTTLAHVIAKHAGYKIREVNASDDRSIEVFRKVLDDTTQSRAESFQDGKPNCLIIDEIDGASAASVSVLIEYMTGNATEKGKGKKKLKKYLRRPVICICNDLYAPSLKELRKLAFVVQFPQIPVSRLVDRLSEISSKEKLYVDSNTLQALCERSDCDVRSCLSTLQFLKRNLCSSREALGLIAQVGTKDKSKGFFSVWTDIFTLPPEKRYRDAFPDQSKPEMRFKNMLQIAQNHGEYEKLFGGVFENYLRIKFKDIYLQSVMEGLEWATWFETMQEYTDRTQTYGLYGYLPMYFVMAHLLYARNDSLRIHFPSPELYSRVSKIQSIVKSQISETTPSTARFLDGYMLITDIYPAVLSIIQPCTIRPVPSQIWTQRERDTLKNVVDIMLTHNLTYTQTKHPETGAYSFVLEPNLEEMVRFKDVDGHSSVRKPFPYAIKQLVSREIETEKLRRNDLTPEVVRRDTTPFKPPQTPKSTASSSTPKSKSGAVGNVSNKIVQSSIGRDFFGRPIMPVPETSPEAAAKKKSATAVYFRFKEGYSNAVRRFVKMKDL